MHLLYINFGAATITHHYQAAFSIYSLVGKEGVTDITVLTDAPAFYKHLESHVQIIYIDAATQRDWIGPYGFFFRSKIKALSMICEKYPDQPVLYLDTDTFAFHSIKQLADQLNRGNAIMHLNEGSLSSGKTRSEQRIWHYIQQKKFGSYTVTGSDTMWNAGVVGTPNTNGGKEFDLALTICDAICAANVKTHMNEQFAVSVALQKLYTIKEAQTVIAHYWSNKEEWNHAIAQFLSAAYMKATHPDDVIDLVSEFDFTGIPVKKLEKNTARRLNRLVNHWFPPKSVQYIER